MNEPKSGCRHGSTPLPPLHDLINTDEVLEAVAQQHFGEDYNQRTNETWDNRDTFLEHLRHLRSVIHPVKIEVLDELATGAQYAGPAYRHHLQERRVYHETRSLRLRPAGRSWKAQTLKRQLWR